MAVIFNGIDLNSVFFNGIELDTIFFNGVEVFSSAEPVQEFILDFDGVEDFYTIQAEERSFNIPATGDFSWGGVITIDEAPANARTFMGRSAAANDTPHRYQLQMQANGNLRFYSGSIFCQSSGFAEEFAGVPTLIECKWVGLETQIFVNGVLRQTADIPQRPVDDPVAQFLIGGQNNNAGTGINHFSKMQLSNWFFDTEFTPVNEGEGLIVTGDEGTSGQINRESQWRLPREFLLSMDSTFTDQILFSGLPLIQRVKTFWLAESFNLTNENDFIIFNNSTAEFIRMAPFGGEIAIRLFTNNGDNLSFNSNLFTPSDGDFSIDLTFNFTNGNVDLEIIQDGQPTQNVSGIMGGLIGFDWRMSRIQNRSPVIGKITQFEHNTEVFPCNEGGGLTVTGDEGTVGTITRETMWEEIPPEFKLVFDSTEEDDFTIPVSVSRTWTTYGDILFDFTSNIQATGSNQNLFSMGAAQATGLFRLFINGSGNIQMTVYDSGGNLFINSFAAGVITVLDNALFEFIGGELFLNGDVILSFPSSNPALITNDIIHFGADSELGDRFSIQELQKCTIDTEFFPCNEGQGLTVTGSEGTTGTITREEMWEPLI